MKNVFRMFDMASPDHERQTVSMSGEKSTKGTNN